MRHNLIAAAFAAAALLASGPALANLGPQPQFQAGGPARVDGWCKVVTDHGVGHYGMDNFGYYAPCSRQAMTYAPRAQRYR